MYRISFSSLSVAILLSASLMTAAEAEAPKQGAKAAPAARAAPARSAPRMAAPRAAPRSAPHIAAPRSAPRIAAPRHAPAARSVQRAPRQVTPTARVQQRINRAPQQAQRKERVQQRAQQRQQTIQQRAQQKQLPAAQALQNQNQTKKTAAQVRRQERLDRLQQRAQSGKLNRADRRQLRTLERQQARDRRLQPQQAQQNRLERRANRAARVTQQQARQGRFASRFHDRQTRRADRIAARLAARQAWREHRRARFVAWAGALYWPYAYSDVFDYTFWPNGYDAGYWAYAYDDFFDGIFFPDGAPYSDTAYAGPYANETTGVAAGSGTPGRVSDATRQLCSQPDKGVTAWPFEKIESAIQPNGEQQTLLADLKKAAAQAADRFKAACPENVPLTPAGRLQAMSMKLQATLDAVKLVRPPLEKFYASLSDEQKARFNELGPDLGKTEQTARSDQPAQAADCGGGKAGLSGLPIDRIEDVVQPTDQQEAILDRLSQAMDKAVDRLQSACPGTVAVTPVGRLEAMQTRLEAMIEAGNLVRPALEDFYASLSNEQKAKFNRLGKDAANGG